VFNTQISAFLCPSDAPERNVSLCSYLGNYGGPMQQLEFSGTFLPTPSADWPTTSIVKISTITDGTSNTALFSEGLTGAGEDRASLVTPGAGARSKRVHFPAPAMSNFARTIEATNNQIAACQAVAVTTPGTGGGRGDWFRSYPFYVNFNVYNHLTPPNSIACSSSQTASSNTWGQDAFGAAPPSSNHSGGVNMTMADGSVRFIKDSVNRTAWWALGTRNGGEVLSSDQY
jgi:prepilin-type processing-associated H-X9-DG protein